MALGDSPLGEFFDKMRSLEQGPLLGRLEELRARIIRCMGIVFVVFVGCFTFAKHILLYLEQPLVQALPKGARVLHFTGPMEVFVAYIQVSFMIALFIAAPILLVQIWNFIKPALPDFDKGMVLPFFVASLSLFVGGIAFCFYVMMPVALQFLIDMGKDVAIPTIMVADYVSLTTFMLLGFGLVFQLPVVMIILERLGVIDVAFFTGNRSYILVGILVVAAVVTPTPDPFSQLAMAVPMYVMFEAAIVIIKLLKRRDANTSTKQA